MRRVKPQKSNIVKFLEEVGYEDVFSTNEVKEIKELFSKNPQTMSKNELLLDSIHKFDADEETKHKSKQAKSKPITTYYLRNHMDAVRDGLFLPNSDTAVTVSEDCTIRLWDLKNINQEDKHLTEDIKYDFVDDGSDFAGDSKSFYSYYTLRGHTGIVTKVAAAYNPDLADDSETLLYTAGIEGLVRVWKVPKTEEINQFGQDSDLTSKLCTYVWEAHSDEIIWDLKYNRINKSMVLTAGADGLVKLWNAPSYNQLDKILDEVKDNDQQSLEDRLLIREFVLESKDEGLCSPTSLDWSSSSSNTFITCYNSGVGCIYDIKDSNPILQFALSQTKGNLLLKNELIFF